MDMHIKHASGRIMVFKQTPYYNMSYKSTSMNGAIVNQQTGHITNTVDDKTIKLSGGLTTLVVHN